MKDGHPLRWPFALNYTPNTRRFLTLTSHTTMKVTFAHLCDYALVSADRKLAVIGIFNRIFAQRLPHIHPQIFLAFEIDLDYTEATGSFDVRIECVDADGTAVFKIGSRITVAAQSTPKPGEPFRAPQVVRLNQVTFGRAGKHDINIFLNNRVEHRIEFEVAVIASPPGPIVLPGGPAPQLP